MAHSFTGLSSPTSGAALQKEGWTTTSQGSGIPSDPGVEQRDVPSLLDSLRPPDDLALVRDPLLLRLVSEHKDRALASDEKDSTWKSILEEDDGTVELVDDCVVAVDQCFENEKLKKFKVNRHRTPIWLPCVGDEADRYGRKKSSEPPHWSNERGKEECSKHSFELSPPANGARWVWASPWTLDKAGGRCDNEGWTYAQTFNRAKTGSRFDHGVKLSQDGVRRRRWFRVRILDPCGLFDKCTAQRAPFAVLRELLRLISWHFFACSSGRSRENPHESASALYHRAQKMYRLLRDLSFVLPSDDEEKEDVSEAATPRTTKAANSTIQDLMPHLEFLLKTSTECQTKVGRRRNSLSSVASLPSTRTPASSSVFSDGSVLDESEISTVRERGRSRSQGPPRKSTWTRTVSEDSTENFDAESPSVPVPKTNSLLSADRRSRSRVKTASRKLSHSVRRKSKKTREMLSKRSSSLRRIHANRSKGSSSSLRRSHAQSSQGSSSSLRRSHAQTSQGSSSSLRRTHSRQGSTSSLRRAHAQRAEEFVTPPRRYTRDEVDDFVERMGEIIRVARAQRGKSLKERVLTLGILSALGDHVQSRMSSSGGGEMSAFTVFDELRRQSKDNSEVQIAGFFTLDALTMINTLAEDLEAQSRVEFPRRRKSSVKKEISTIQVTEAKPPVFACDEDTVARPADSLKKKKLGSGLRKRFGSGFRIKRNKTRSRKNSVSTSSSTTPTVNGCLAGSVPRDDESLRSPSVSSVSSASFMSAADALGSWEDFFFSGETELMKLGQQFFSLLGGWLTSYHASADLRLNTEYVNRCLELRACMGQLLSTWAVIDGYSPKTDIGGIIRVSSRDKFDSIRRSLPDNIVEWTEAQWASFSTQLLDIVELDAEELSAKMKIDGLKYPGQYSVSTMLVAVDELTQPIMESSSSNFSKVSHVTFEVLKLAERIRQLKLSDILPPPEKRPTALRTFVRGTTKLNLMDAQPSSVNASEGPSEISADNPADSESSSPPPLPLPHLERIVRRIVRGFLQQLHKNIDAWISATMQAETYEPYDDASSFSFSVVDTFAYLAGFQQKYIDLVGKLPAFARGLTKDDFLKCNGKLVGKYATLVLEGAGDLEPLARAVERLEAEYAPAHPSLDADAADTESFRDRLERYLKSEACSSAKTSPEPSRDRSGTGTAEKEPFAKTHDSDAKEIVAAAHPSSSSHGFRLFSNVFHGGSRTIPKGSSVLTDTDALGHEIDVGSPASPLTSSNGAHVVRLTRMESRWLDDDDALGSVDSTHGHGQLGDALSMGKVFSAQLKAIKSPIAPSKKPFKRGHQRAKSVCDEQGPLFDGVDQLAVRFANLCSAKRRLVTLRTEFVKAYRTLQNKTPLLGDTDEADVEEDSVYSSSMADIDGKLTELSKILSSRVVYFELGNSLLGKLYRRSARGKLASAHVLGIEFLSKLSRELQALDDLLSHEEEEAEVAFQYLFVGVIKALEFNLLKSQRTFEMRDIKALRIDLSEIYKLFGDYIEDIDFLLESKSAQQMEAILDHMEKPTDELLTDLMEAKFSDDSSGSPNQQRGELAAQGSWLERSAEDEEVKLTRFEILSIFAHRNDEEAKQIVDTENALAVLSSRHRSVSRIVAEQKQDGEKTEDEGSDEEAAQEEFDAIPIDATGGLIPRLQLPFRIDSTGKKHPVSADGTEYHLSVTVHQAKGLPRFKLKGCKPYAVLRFDDQAAQTGMCFFTTKPRWNKKFDFFFNFTQTKRSNKTRPIEPTLHIEVYHAKSLSADEKIGQYQLLLGPYIEVLHGSKSDGSRLESGTLPEDSLPDGSDFVSIAHASNLFRSTGQIRITVQLSHTK